MSYIFKLQWQFANDVSLLERKLFSSLSAVFKLTAKPITGGSLNDVIQYDSSVASYYIKRYYYGGKGLRRYFAVSRARREWYNLQRFQSMNIASPPWVLFGEEQRWGMHCRAVLITRAIPHSVDLVTLFERADPLLQNAQWRYTVGRQIMHYVAQLHSVNFIHGDLKWRNILLGGEKLQQVFFIDCPQGKTMSARAFKRGMIKDLACLAKRASFILSLREQIDLLAVYCQCVAKPTNLMRLARQIVKEQNRRYARWYKLSNL